VPLVPSRPSREARQGRLTQSPEKQVVPLAVDKMLVWIGKRCQALLACSCDTTKTLILLWLSFSLSSNLCLELKADAAE
jgi:hypothetical protein